MRINKPNVAIILFPWASKAPYNFVNDILKILDPISNELFVISGNTKRINGDIGSVKILDTKLTVHYAKDKRPLFFSYVLWLVKCIIIQFIITFRLITVSKDVDAIIYMAYPFHFMPLITGKLMGKRNIDYLNRFPNQNFIYKFLDNLNFRLMDVISPQSSSLLSEKNFKKYHCKISAECSRFVEYDKNDILDIKERDNVVGFIGRIKKEKGIVEFINSIPLILAKNPDVKFLIAGDGDLVNWVETEISKLIKECDAQIKFVGWIPRSEILDVLRSLKMLVMPTYTEGLPTIMLESMAVGTPVLSTPVGGVPDVIKDNHTGFIINDLSPECLANDIINVLNFQNLDKIVINQTEIIEKKFSYEAALKRWELILNHEKV